jgi:hypothetical protein
MSSWEMLLVKDFYQLLDSFARAKYREENLE